MRLFVPSWQLPGTWAENLAALEAKPWVEGVELLFFSWDADTRRLFEREASQIEGFSGRFAFSLHLPDPLVPEAVDLVRATATYVERYVLHPGHGAAWAKALLACAQAAGSAVSAEGAAGVAAASPDAGAVGGRDAGRSPTPNIARFALERTGSADYEACAAEFPGLSLCADTGSLLSEGQDPASWASQHADRIGELHLHAARRDTARGRYREHLPLAGDEPWLGPLLSLAERKKWTVNLETFDIEATRASYGALRRPR